MARTGRPRKPRIEVPCEHCGATLEKLQSDIDRSATGRFFCNRDCRNAEGSNPRRGTTEPCGTCGEDVYRRPSYDKDVRFCSKNCHDEWQARDREERVCVGCELTFSVAVSEPDIYCSRECYTRTRREEATGSRHISSDGYIRVFHPEHPNADALGRVAEHRLVMEEALGRPLLSDEQVHHIDADRANNDPENLELWTLTHPSGARVADLLSWVEQFLTRYPPELHRILRG